VIGNGAACLALRWLLERVRDAIGVAPVLSILESVVETDFRAVIAGLRLPTLVVLGGSSHHYGGLPLAEYYAAALARGVVRTYDAAAHSPHRQEPKRFAEELAGFATRHCA
jgi:pimeloyl-ACP methyl ester carboxylesterase